MWRELYNLGRTRVPLQDLWERLTVLGEAHYLRLKHITFLGNTFRSSEQFGRHALQRTDFISNFIDIVDASEVDEAHRRRDGNTVVIRFWYEGLLNDYDTYVFFAEFTSFSPTELLLAAGASE